MSRSFSPAIGWRGADSRATQQPRAKAKRSRRFSFEHCRPFIALGCGVVSMGFLANAAQSFATSDDLSMILFGVSSMPFGALCGWFLAPASPRREAREAAELAEMEERQRRFTAAAQRIQVLKAERQRLSKAKKSCEAVDKELKALTNLLLAGA